MTNSRTRTKKRNESLSSTKQMMYNRYAPEGRQVGISKRGI